MGWRITINAYGTVEETSNDAPTIGEALTRAVEDLGFDENDEGHLIIDVSGGAG